MELQIELHCPQGSGDIKIATPMELQFDLDLDFPQGQDDIKIPIPNGTWTVHHHLREVNMSFLVKRMQI